MNTEQFFALSDEEVAALTEEQIQAVIDYKCAEEGLKFVEQPTVREWPVIEPDIEAFTVSGFHFLDRAEAEKVCDLVNSLQSRRDSEYVSYHSSAYERKLVPAEPENVGRASFYSDTHYANKRALIKQTAREKEDYKKAQKEWESYDEARRAYAEEITNRVEQANAAVYEKNRIRADFARYVELAQGNKDIALNFLKKAYGEISPELQGELNPAPEIETKEEREGEKENG